VTDSALGLWGLPLALAGGALRVSAPYLFVSLGECLTEKSGRINLGQEGTLIMVFPGPLGWASSQPVWWAYRSVLSTPGSALCHG
jgi:ABC-type uncharacterized transport system permease subunit